MNHQEELANQPGSQFSDEFLAIVGGDGDQLFLLKYPADKFVL
jgi:hypothetical protein